MANLVVFKWIVEAGEKMKYGRTCVRNVTVASSFRERVPITGCWGNAMAWVVASIVFYMWVDVFWTKRRWASSSFA